MTFRVGQKVVCVNASLGFASGKPVQLVKGRVYEVHAIEWLGTINVGGLESYCPTRFRPLIERKTDISIFEKMLNPQGTDA